MCMSQMEITELMNIRKFRVNGYFGEKLYIDSIVEDYLVKIEDELDRAHKLYNLGMVEESKKILDKFESDIRGVISVTETVEKRFQSVDMNCGIVSIGVITSERLEIELLSFATVELDDSVQ